MSENRKGEMNYAAELAVKVEEKHMELDGVCVLNIRSYQKFVKAYDLLKKLALLHNSFRLFYSRSCDHLFPLFLL